jgi:hypothetical protein
MWEIVVFGLVVYVIFRDILEAKAEELRARARAIELEVEMNEHDFYNETGKHPDMDAQEEKEVGGD